MKQYGPQHAKRQKKKRDLERKVLAHLNKFGPSLYDALSVRFDTKHATDIQPILRGLKEYGYIEMDREKMVMITTFGLQQLQ